LDIFRCHSGCHKRHHCHSGRNSCDNGCGCNAEASCGCGATGGSAPAASAPSDDAAPMPPAPTADPSASIQSKRRVVSATSVVIRRK
jgi:hypothetical protein